jgi:hypothetical protein
VSDTVLDLCGGLMKDAWGSAETPDIGEGGMVEFTVNVNTALVGAGTVTASLVTKAANGSISASGTTVATLAVFAATAAAGTKRSVKVPSGSILRYLGVLYVTTGSLTSSKFDSFLSLDHSSV